MSVYRSFFAGARAGRFTLTRGGDLWRLLAAMTKHKLLHHTRYHRASRRSVDLEHPFDEAVITRGKLAETVSDPEAALALAEEVEQVLAALDPFSRRVLELRLQGAQFSEISRDTERSERTVRRTLARIRGQMADRFNHV